MELRLPLSLFALSDSDEEFLKIVYIHQDDPIEKQHNKTYKQRKNQQVPGSVV